VVAFVAAAVLVVAGIVATVILVANRSEASGASSPSEAVEGLVQSLEDNDLLGAVDVLAPWERDFARTQIDRYLDDAKDAGLLDDDADLGDVGGYTLEVDDLQVEPSEVNERIVNVALTGGTARFQSQIDELPLGAKILDQLRRSDDGRAPEDVDTTADLAEASLPPLTTIEQDGRWYVSLFYTVAEAARQSADAPVPTVEAAVPAVGADSPEAAVDAMIGALETGDVRRMIELTPPDEMGVLHDYAPLFLDEEGGPDTPSATFDDLAYEVVDVDGGKKVIPTRFTITATEGDPTTVRYERTDDRIQLSVQGGEDAGTLSLGKIEGGVEFSVQSDEVQLTGQVTSAGENTMAIAFQGQSDGDQVTADLTAEPDGSCIVVAGTVTSGDESEQITERLCPEDLDESGTVEIFGEPLELGELLGNVNELVQFDRLSRLFDVGLVAVEVDGDWYVSPLRSTGELFGTFAGVFEGLRD
jgi:hypothetical protein